MDMKSIHSMKGENFQMKPEEQRVLGILATIFGAIALLGSWIPFINYPSLFIGIVAFILGIIGLIVNLKKRKNSYYRNIPGSCLCCTFLYDSGTIRWCLQRVCQGVLPLPTWIRMPQWNAKKKAAWQTIPSPGPKNSFDALIEGDLDNKGKGGTTYEDIINKHGKPDSEFDFTLGGYNTKKITYISIGDKTKTVTLTFAKQDNGQLLLVQKHAVGLGLEKNKQQNDSETWV